MEFGYTGRIQQRFVTSGFDTLGRWAWVQFAGTASVFRIYSVYRVNHNSDYNTGESTAWCQQREILLNNGLKTNPRKQVIIDLSAEIEPLINEGFSVLVMGDMNETLSGPEKTNSKFFDIGLINILQNRIGDGLPMTHKKGTKEIDHVWGTQTVVNAITAAGYAPFNYIDGSDYRALIFDLDLRMILDHDLENVKQIAQGRLK